MLRARVAFCPPQLRRRFRRVFSARLGGYPGQRVRAADKSRSTALSVHLAPEAEQGAGGPFLRRLGETARAGGVADGTPARRAVGVRFRLLVDLKTAFWPTQNDGWVACARAFKMFLKSLG